MIISTAGAEQKVLKTKKKAWAETVKAAIEQAIVERG